MVYKKNWRDMQPEVTHMSAVVWGGLRAWEREDDEDDLNRLRHVYGFARHALQGRKTSDHHRHENIEQVYYVLTAIQGWRGERASQVHASLTAFYENTNPTHQG